MDFEYAGKRLSDLGYMMCCINSASGDYEIDSISNLTFTTIKNRHSSIYNIVDSTYENTYVVTFDIMKNPCISNGNTYMTSLEVRELMKWLNRKEYARLRFINNTANESNVYYYGSFNIKQIMIGENIIGLTLTFTSNAPYGFGEIVNNEYIFESPEQKVQMFADSDEFGVIYPKITLFCKQAGDYVIINRTTGTETIVNNCQENEQIIIDGEYRIILSSMESHKTLPNDFNYEYLDVLSSEDYTPNEYYCNLPCELTISYMPVRKVGVF